MPHIALTRIPTPAGNARDFATLSREWPKLYETGHTVCIFPGGTRTAYFNATKSGDDGFSPVAARMAKNLKAPLVPCAVQTGMWSNVKRWKSYDVHPGPVRIAFGEALPVGTSDKETYPACVDFISRTLRSWGVEVRGDSPAAPAQGS